MIPETLEIISQGSPEWMKKAHCADADPRLFHPEPGEENTERVKEAKRICRNCPVRRHCLRWAYETNDIWAVLGGLTANQRTRVKRRIRRRDDLAAARPDQDCLAGSRSTREL